MKKQEELLIRKAQRGNLHSFEELVRQYDEKVMQLIYNMVNDTEDAQDLYQEVFIKVFKSIKKFRFKSEFYTWLFRITVNTCINFRNRRGNIQYTSLDEYLDGQEKCWKMLNDTKTTNPESNFLNLELNDKIQNGIDKLSPKQKSVFILRHYHGNKLSEIAQILGCAEGTVKNYLFRAIQKMKKSLSEYNQI